MSESRENVKTIFGKAIEIRSEEERARYLDQACAADESLRAEIEGLLGAIGRAGEFLVGPSPASPTIDQPIPEKPGTQIGPYKLLQKVGEGGMGVVYMAEQKEPVKRRVALKIIKPGMDTRQVIARFEAERQALAMMDHPNIAKVLDAGATESGRPYFVMELVNGLPVTKYCDEQHLTPKERLELFVPICQAVQHAHQKGIIHRDLKPSNILVALYDGQAVPKVIDFGVAKATSQTLTDKTMFTQLGQVVGTLEYMSPEQAERNQLDVDTRSDIYSLGVVLYELLTGETPFDRKRLRMAAFEEVLKIIRDEEPSKPSTKVSGSQSLPSIAANRRIEPARLGSMMRGELDWIVLKAIAKDRSRRYETANGFAKDVERYLENETVEACPPSTAYRFRTFYRRNRVAFMTASLVAAALVLGIFASTWQAVRATRAERLAEQRLASEQRARNDAVAARQAEADQRRRAEFERTRAEEKRSDAEANFRMARRAVDRYFTTISDHELLHEAGMEPLRKSLLEAALEYYHEFAGQQADDPGVLGELAAAHSRIAQIYAATGSTAWPAAWARYLDIVEKLHRDDVDPSIWASSLEGSFRYTRNTTPRVDDLPATLRTFQRGVELFGELAEKHPDVIAFEEELATNCLIVGFLQSGIFRLEESSANYRHALSIWQELARKNPGQPLYANHIVMVFNNLPWNMDNTGRRHEVPDLLRDAIETLREAYGNENDAIVYLLDLLSSRLLQQGRLDEAESHLREAVSICEKQLNQPITPRSMESLRLSYAKVCESLGELYFRSGRFAEAERLIQKAGRISQELASQSESPAAKEVLIDSLLSQGKLTEALEEAQNAARRHPDTWYLHQRLRTVLYEIGDTEETLAVMRENAHSLRDCAEAYHQYGLALFDHDKLNEAANAFQAALKIKPTRPWTSFNIAKIRLQQDRLLDALEAVQSAIRMSPTVPEFHSCLLEIVNRIDDAEGFERASTYVGQMEAIFPNNSADLSARMGFVDFLGRAGSYQEAAKALEGMDEDVYGWEYDRALLYVHTKQFGAYRRLCQLGLNRIDIGEDLSDWKSLGVQCKLAPNAVTDYTPILDLLENTVSTDPDHRLRLSVRAHLVYRSGQAEAAVKQLDRLVSNEEAESIHQPFDKLFLAMAYHDLGHEADAARYFREAAEWLDKNGQVELHEGAVLPEPLNWRLRLELELLRREAEQLLGIMQAPTEAPNDNR